MARLIRPVPPSAFCLRIPWTGKPERSVVTWLGQNMALCRSHPENHGRSARILQGHHQRESTCHRPCAGFNPYFHMGLPQNHDGFSPILLKNHARKPSAPAQTAFADFLRFEVRMWKAHLFFGRAPFFFFKGNQEDPTTPFWGSPLRQAQRGISFGVLASP